MPRDTARSLIGWLAHGVWWKLRREWLPAATAHFRFLRSPNQLLSIWPEREIALGARVALFAHFHRRGAVYDHVLHYVSELAANGFSVIFVSNSGRLAPDAVDRLRPLCAAVLVRRNIGYDFGAWREAIELLGLPRPNTDMVVLANDSVYGPLLPIGETLGRIDFDQSAVWGLTESWQMGYHLQSYFLAFGPRALHNPAWARFWQAVRPAPSKHWVIRQYELGLSQAMIRAGFDCKAVWSYDELTGGIDPDLFSVSGEEDDREPDPLVVARARHTRQIRSRVVERVPLNPTSDLWRQLLQKRYPFIKRELLRDNPTFIPDISEWREIISEWPKSDLDSILMDLKRTLRNRTP